jgi:hypothetical protein
MPKQQLVGFFMDHAGRGSPPHTFGMDGQVHLFIDGIQFVGTPLGPVCRIGDHPQPFRPGHHRPDPAFADLRRRLPGFKGVGAEVGINPADERICRGWLRSVHGESLVE